MARILVVTSLWSGLADILVEGKKTPSGMPGFFGFLKGLVERGHQVDLAVEDPRGRGFCDPEIDWMRNLRILPIQNRHRTHWGRLTTLVTGTLALIRVLRRGRYDLVYGQGTFGTLGVQAANLTGVPAAQRLYGAWPLNKKYKEQSLLSLSFRHPLAVGAFRQKKEFLLVTNDGSQGDLVQKALGSDSYEFYFWRNGIDCPSATAEWLDRMGNRWGAHGLPENNFLFYPARIERWKRQDRGIELLKRCHQEGASPKYLVMAGQVNDESWDERLREMMAEQSLSDYCYHVSRLTRDEVFYGYLRAEMVLSFYELSNLGNVVIEALSAGSLVGSLNDGSLDGVIANNENGVLADDACSLVDYLGSDQESRVTRERIKKKAAKSAREIFPCWRERIDREIKLVEKIVGQAD